MKILAHPIAFLRTASGMGASLSAFVASMAFMPPEPSIFERWGPPANISVLELPKSRVRIPLLYAEQPAARFTILFSHGNAESLAGLRSMARFMNSELECNFAAFEFPGYAQTAWIDENCTEPLLPSEATTLEAAERALTWLIEERRIEPRTIVLFGRSLGSGAAVHLAANCGKSDVPLAGLVLQSPIASAFRTMMPGLWWTLPYDIFANIDKIGDVRCTTTIVHGTADRVVPIANAKQLAAALPPALLFEPLYIEGAGHNNIERQFGHLWLEHMRKFLARLSSD